MIIIIIIYFFLTDRETKRCKKQETVGTVIIKIKTILFATNKRIFCSLLEQHRLPYLIREIVFRKDSDKISLYN